MPGGWEFLFRGVSVTETPASPLRRFRRSAMPRRCHDLVTGRFSVVESELFLVALEMAFNLASGSGRGEYFPFLISLPCFGAVERPP